MCVIDVFVMGKQRSNKLKYRKFNLDWTYSKNVLPFLNNLNAILNLLST